VDLHPNIHKRERMRREAMDFFMSWELFLISWNGIFTRIVWSL
jgi:hypothetical protein